MASGLSHMMLSSLILPKVTKKPRTILSGNAGFYSLGAIAPDLPYILAQATSFLDKTDIDVADGYHTKEDASKIVCSGILELSKMDNSNRIKDALFSFYTGFASHIVLDGIVHPFVRDKVGDYDKEGVPKAHRLLEMRLDVYSAKSEYGSELNRMQFQDTIDLIDEEEDIRDAVFSHYTKIHNDNYSTRISEARVHIWRRATKEAFEASANCFPTWYKSLAGAMGIAHFNYQNIKDKEASDIVLGKPCDGLKQNFKKQVNVDYFKDVMPQYYKIFSSIIEKLYAASYEGKGISEIGVASINLDTGRLYSNLDLAEVPYYWRT